MGFADTYEAPTADFVSPAEKEELIASGSTFLVTAVRLIGTKFGPTYFVTLVLDGEERTLTFKQANQDGGVPRRDHILESYAEYLKDGGGAEFFGLKKSNRSILFVPASSMEE